MLKEAKDRLEAVSVQIDDEEFLQNFLVKANCNVLKYTREGRMYKSLGREEERSRNEFQLG